VSISVSKLNFSCVYHSAQHMSLMHVFVQQKMTFTMCCYTHSTAHDCTAIPCGLTHVSSLRKPLVVVNTAKFIFNLHINGLIPFFAQSLFIRGN